MGSPTEFKYGRSMGEFQFADVFEEIAEAVPDQVAVIHGARQVTWREFDRRANALAADLLAAGLGHASKVAAYLYNSPEYLETYFAATKAAMWPVNTNYRYGVEEITYLFENADAEAVVFDTAFTAVAEQVRARLASVRRWYAVGPNPPHWAVPYESVVGAGVDSAPAISWPRAATDVVMTYTGGTTGMPKGVMWSHAALFQVMGHGGNAVLGIAPADLRLFEHPTEKLSHYSTRTVDIEYRFGFPGGEWGELEGIANRTDYDLTVHAKASGVTLDHFDQEKNLQTQI